MNIISRGRKKISDIIGGSIDNFSMEHRNLNITCFITGIITLFVVWFNYHFKTTLINELAVDIFGFINIAVYYLSRIK